MAKRMMKGAKLPGNSTVVFEQFEVPTPDMDRCW